MDENYHHDFYKHSKIKTKKNILMDKGVCGLVNLGNKCFFNSIIHCLSNTLQLTDYFLSSEYKNDISVKNKLLPENTVLNSYIQLINVMWDDTTLIKPKLLLENLASFHKKYYSSQQQDSHECLLYIIEKLHKSLSYEIEITLNKPLPDVLLQKSLTSYLSFYENSYSYLIKTLYGTSLTNINCSNCDFNEPVFEPFNTISLDLSDDIYTSLSNYCKNETIESWKCEKCIKSGCVKRTYIWDSPEYLIIQLKLFNNDGTKNIDKLNYPINNLDITQYIHESNRHGNNFIYDLYAVNHHAGDSLSGGHYWSSCKKIDNNWYTFNDTRVYRSKTLNTSNAYILFYQRKKILYKL